MGFTTTEGEGKMQISNLHRFRSSYYGAEGWAAEITLEAGDRIIVSKYDDEQKWIADGFYAASCDWFPVYWTGEGAEGGCAVRAERGSCISCHVLRHRRAASAALFLWPHPFRRTQCTRVERSCRCSSW